MMSFFQPGSQIFDTSQQCPSCGVGQPQSRRYLRYLCLECFELASDESGRHLLFSNVDLSGGFQAEYADTGEVYPSHICFVRGARCWADEARFGGIVIQPQNATDMT